eukprot:237016-Prymnesium_polylepis.1
MQLTRACTSVIAVAERALLPVGVCVCGPGALNISHPREIAIPTVSILSDQGLLSYLCCHYTLTITRNPGLGGCNYESRLRP